MLVVLVAYYFVSRNNIEHCRLQIRPKEVIRVAFDKSVVGSMRPSALIKNRLKFEVSFFINFVQ